MENEIRERSVEVDGMTLTLLHKDGKWVFPLVTYYQHGLGTPLCLALLAYVEDSNEFESETNITVNLPGAERSAGCQFIDTNNNGEEVLDWLMRIMYPYRQIRRFGFLQVSRGGFLSERTLHAAERALRQVFQLRCLTCRRRRSYGTAFMALPASVLLYGYLSGISSLFYPAFPTRN